ncbi:MAG: hypothetical protein QOD89_2835 [Bradyrhizobium sp.]|jgi:uncharacterized protein YjbI with pentapeptide repeats|nr:hypothetical protein [Bradyrhizobium sp.]
MPKARKINPFDIEALEKLLNDSAARVSKIWISFMTFSLYMLVAAVTVDHRQLLLAEPVKVLLAELVKLPILNIDFPLWGFFFLAPYLLVIFHVYVLLQVLLLGRTAAAYNAALDQTITDAAPNSAMRQRLANTLFAQIFAGSPRERDGWLGRLLKSTAWATLAVVPILILLVFQFAFLPYHSHLVTWSHRLLILAEIAATFLVWPLILDARQDLALRGFRPYVFLLTSCAVFIFFSLSLATFPGEPHVNIFTAQPLFTVQCTRGYSSKFDRLYVPGIDVVDDEKLAKIAQATSDRNLPAYQGERTRNFRNRNFNCADLSSADLRRVDLTNASLVGAILDSSNLEAISGNAANLRGASFENAHLQGANLDNAQLQAASFERAQLQGASLFSADLQGALLERAELQGAAFAFANLEGASLVGAKLHGAVLYSTNLQGASLVGSQLQGANAFSANLKGAFLFRTQLQGSNLREIETAHTDLSEAYVWRAKIGTCPTGRSDNLKFEAVVESNIPGDNNTPLEIDKFIERTTASIPDSLARHETAKRMRLYLGVNKAKDDTAEIAKMWSDCQNLAEKTARGKFEQELVTFLRRLVCNAQADGAASAMGIITGWDIIRWPLEISNLSANERSDRVRFSGLLARALLGEDGSECKTRKDFDESTKKLLRGAIARAVIVPVGVTPEKQGQ